jgi:cell wall-associated NlpC family hydrolase
MPACAWPQACPQATKAYRWYESQGVCMDSTAQPLLFANAYEWAGTRYQYGRAQKQKGTDCSGFVGSVYREVYCMELHRSSADIWPQAEPVRKEDLQTGDLVFFKIRKGHISHVGIYLGNNKFIHAAVKGGVIVSDLGEPYYQRYFFMGGRVNNCEAP